MKITNVTAYHLPGTRYPWVFLKVDTDEGVYGWGQASSGPHSGVVAAAASRLAPILIGEDPTRIEFIWHKLYASFNSLGSLGFVSALISGIDIALWDIRGKMLGLPIYELLGGKFHENLVLYSNGWFDGCETPEQYAKAARATVDEGHTAIKLDPFKRGAAYLAGYAANYPSHEDYAAVEIIDAIRTEIGNNVEIFIDAHGRFNMPTAVRLANHLRPYRIGWFEEPVPPENWDALKQFRDQTDVPICVGERLYTRWQFRPVLEQKLADYIMPDIIRTGGISEMKKIATLAETFYIPISPHDASGPVNLMAGAQVAISTPNFYRLEARRISLDFYNAFLEEPLKIEGDALIVPEKPGLGVKLSVDYLKAHEIDG